MKQTTQNPEQYDPECQFSDYPEWLMNVSARASYETACGLAGVAPNTDEAIDTRRYALKNAEYTGAEWQGTMGRDERVLFLLDGQRLRGIETERAANRRPAAEPELVTCDCGHRVPRGQRMNASMGTSCPDCYDRMSN